MGTLRGLGIHLIFVCVSLVATAYTCLGVGNVSVVCSQKERIALLRFKHSVEDEYGMLSSWVGKDCCLWERIHCDSLTGTVDILNLTGNHYLVGAGFLVGNEVNSSLAELRHLKYFDLSGNDFQGSRIPEFIGSFKQLIYLNLSHADFQGIIPPHIGNLSNLKVLDLSSNYFGLTSDDMSWTFGLPSLEDLDLSWVDLGGAKNMDIVLYNLPSLKELSLYWCGLCNVDLGSSLNSSRILANIKHLDLGLNSFEPPLPGIFRNMTSLEFLDLSYFNLSLSWNFASLLTMIPSSLSELHLSHCGLHNTHLSSPHFNFSTLSNIQHLDLWGNSIEGIFPSVFTNMSSLSVLDLSGNMLNSSVPIMPNLLELYLSFNQFKNIEDVGIWRQCHLKQLFASSSRFEIEMIDSPQNVSACSQYALEWLDLSGSLNGTIPEALGRLTNLRVLSLSRSSLTGPIPESLGRLRFLEVLDLYGNELTGPIPTFLGNLSTPYLSSNQLNCSIPESFGNLVALTHVDLSFNRLTGPIPACLGRLVTLQAISLSSNQLNGAIPEFFGNLSALTYLDLSLNRLMGPIPACLGRLVSLQAIDMSFNQLNGSIPEYFGNLPALIDLDLGSNQLTGSIPLSVGQLAKLYWLDISDNSLEGVVSEAHFANLSMLKDLNASSNTKLTFNVSHEWIPPFQLVYLDLSSCNIANGFPQWLQNQRKLYQLVLSNATISGPLPTWLRKMRVIPILDLSHNKLSGPLTNLPNGENVDGPTGGAILLLVNNLFNESIPRSLCRRPDLALLDLSRNRLTGKIPKCLENLQGLETMIFSSNLLSGVIPRSIGLNHSLLHWLKLNDNKFIGELPRELGNLQALRILDVGDNQLFGNIPHWIGENLTNLIVLRLHGNNFTGEIPESLCKMSKLQILDVAYNNITGIIPHFLGELEAMVKGAEKWYGGTSDSNENVIQVMKGVDLEYTKTWDLVYNMDLSSNELVGEIPVELTALCMLLGVNLSNNHLSGKIPDDIKNMTALFSLDLSGNKLTGMIPPSMAALTFLSHLNLSNNNLWGRIPTGRQLQTLNDPSIYAGNKGLCGAPLLKNCSNHEDQTTAFKKKLKAVGESMKVWLFYVDIMSGFATGFWGVIGVLLLKKHWRHKLFMFAEETVDKIYVAVVVRVAKMKRGREAT